MKIGELAARAGLASSAIRFYESAGLLPQASRGANGYRVYDDSSLQRVRAIQLAQRLGFSLERLRKVMDDSQGMPHELIIQSLRERLQEIDTMQQALSAQRNEAEALMQRLQRDWEAGRCLDLGGRTGRTSRQARR
jgi:MerR family copper efflux transcriptional regulator